MTSSKSTALDNGRATIFDVAEMAGVSIKTVSRVVNKEPNVREKTREKVLAAVDKLGYRPNAAARGLSSKRSYVIGLIYENPDEFSYTKDVLNGVLKVCEEHGYTLLLRPLTLSTGQLIEQVKQFLTEANVSGVVLPPPIGDQIDVLDILEDRHIPYVTITPREPRAGVVSIDCDDQSATQQLTRFLINQGHMRIGFITGHPDHVASAKRLAGYESALAEAQIPVDPQLIEQGYFDFKSGRDATAQLMRLDQPPSAIVASNDNMAAGVMFEMKERGLAVPDDLAVVGFDDTPVASQIWPPLTTVRQPIEAMARTATEHLIAALAQSSAPPAPETFDCEVVIRGTT